jgi:hypothetical protein
MMRITPKSPGSSGTRSSPKSAASFRYFTVHLNASRFSAVAGPT